ncbi:hypothetical protein PAMA_012105 [Pampus argenteus]
MWSLVPVHLERHVLSAAAGAKALMENVYTGEGRQHRIHLEKMEDNFQPQVKKVAVAIGASLTEQDIDHMPHRT